MFRKQGKSEAKIQDNVDTKIQDNPDAKIQDNLQAKPLSKLLKNTQGSYTLEAALIIPMIILMLISMVFFAMYIYQKFFLLDTAIYSAKQRAATWENSSKQLEDGVQLVPGNDGLYWQLTNDNLVGTSSSLVARKTKDGEVFTNSTLEQGILRTRQKDVQLKYTNLLIQRTVEVKLTEDVIMPVSWLENVLKSRITAKAEAEVVEPVEYIRNIDLTVKYGRELASKLSNLAGSKEEETQPVYASSKSKDKLYHYPDCFHIGNIKKGNLQSLSEEEAISQGYSLCLHCAWARLNNDANYLWR